MSRWHDHIDWVGGYPFEVAKPEQVFDFYQKRGFELKKMRTSGGGHVCNEFVLKKAGAVDLKDPVENRSAKPSLWRKKVKLFVKDEQVKCDIRLRTNVLAQKRTDALQKA